MKKTIRKIFSVLVAACLCTSMVPASAMASQIVDPDDQSFLDNTSAGSIGPDKPGGAGEAGSFTGSGEDIRKGKASAGTKVFGVLEDENFQFTSQSSDQNFASVQDAIDKTQAGAAAPNGPLYAVFGGNNGTYTYTWKLEEVTIDANGDYQYNPHTPATTPQFVGLDGATYNFGQEVTGTFGDAENGVRFEHSIGTNDGLEADHIYCYTLTIKNPSGTVDEDIEAKIYVSIFANYQKLKVFLDQNPQSATSVEGFLYQDGNLLNPTSPSLSGQNVSETSPVYSVIATEAASSSPVQNITQPIQLVLTDLENKPDNEPAYKLDLNVHLGIPDDYPGTLEVGDKVTVYRCDDSTGTVEVMEGTVVTQTDVNGNPVIVDGQPVLSVEVHLRGTSAKLGTFALGYDNPDGSFTVTSATTAGGTISPDETQTYAVGASPKFVMNAQAGYVLKDVSLECDGSPIAVKSGTLAGNVFTLAADQYQMADAEEWTVTAIYEEPTLTADEFAVSASLSYHGTEDASQATMDVISGAADSQPHTVAMGGSIPAPGEPALMMSARDGVYLEFNPGSGFKVKTLKINGTEYAVQGTSYFISVLTENVTIDVEYEDGLPEPTIMRTIDVTVQGGNGMVNGSDGNPTTSTQLRVNQGSTGTVTLLPNPGFMVDEAILKVAGSSDAGIDIAGQVTQDNGQANLQILNVLQDMELTVTFKAEAGNVTVSIEPNGSGADGGTVTPNGHFSLAADTPQQVCVTPNASDATGGAYTVGAITLNGTSISLDSILTARDGGAYYTFNMVILSPDQEPSSDFEKSPNGTDKVLYLNAQSSTLKVRFDPEVPPAPEYATILTSVAEPGGGSITPTQRVKAGEDVDVWVFPDDGKRVKDVTMDGRSVKGQMTDDGGRLTITNVQTDHEVIVSFEDGDSPLSHKTKYTIYPSAGTGGSVTPASEVKVYEGQSQTFSFIPATNYDPSEVIRDGVAVDPANLASDEELDMNGGTYTIKNVQADHNLVFTFAKTDGGTIERSTFTVEVNVGENGTASPLGSVDVARGSNLPITILPDPNHSVSQINVRSKSDTSGNPGINMVSGLTNGVFTQYDVQDDLIIDIVFKPGTDPNQPSTDINNLVRLGTRNVILDPGIIIDPQLAGMTFYKEAGTDHANVNQDVTIQVAAGYALGTIKVNGKTLAPTEVGDGVYKITIPKEEITSRMELVITSTVVPPSTQVVDLRTITVTKEGNGTVSPFGVIDGIVRVETGERQTFYFIPDNDYKVESVQLDGIDVAWDKSTYSYTIDSVTQDMRLHVKFSEEPGALRPTNLANISVTVTPQADDKAHGFASVSTATVVTPGQLSISFKPDSGYETHVYETTTGRVDVTDQLRGGTLHLTNITSDHSYTVEFTPLEQTASYQTVTSSSGDNGHVSPEGTLTVATGAKMTFTFLGDAGYTVDKVWVSYLDENGQEVSQEVAQDVLNSGTMSYTMNINSKTSVWASFKKGQPDGTTVNARTITATASAGGVVSPEKIEIAAGNEATFTIIPVRGFKLKSVLNGSTDVTSAVNNGVYSFTVTTNTTIHAEFETSAASNPEGNKHDVRLEVANSADGQKHGTLSPVGIVSVPHGGSVPFTIIPDEGYQVDTIKILTNGAGTQVITDFVGYKYTCFDVQADKTVTVTFKEGDNGPRPNFYDVQATASVNGSISPAGTIKVAEGGMAMFSFQPNDGYRLSYLVVDGDNVTTSSLVRGQYSFTGVKANHTIHAVYCGADEEAADFVTVNAGNPSGGSITPSGAKLVMKGTNPQYTVSAFYGYTLTDILVNDESIFADGPDGSKNVAPVNNTRVSWSNSTLTLKNIQADTGIVALFKRSSTTEESPAEYSRVTMNINGPGSASFGAGTTVIEALPEGSTMDISLIPDEGKAIGSLSVKAANGEDLDLTDTSAASVQAQLKAIWAKGYITLTADQVNYNVTVFVTFREQTDEEKKEIETGKFTPAKFRTITAQAFGRGSINPSGAVQVARNASITFSMIPTQGYELSALRVDGKDALGMLKGTRTYTFTPGAQDQSIEATFSQLASADQGVTYKVKTAIDGKDGASGKASVAEMEVVAGGSATLYFWPEDGSVLTALSVVTRDKDNNVVEDLHFAYSIPTYTLTDISGDTTVTAHFELGDSPWTITEAYAKASVLEGGGRVSPTEATVPQGCQQTISIIPDSGNEVSFLRVNGEIVYVDANIRSYPLIVDSTDPANPNTLEVMFKDVSAVADDVKVTAKVVAKANISVGSEVGTAEIWPTERTIPYGTPASFYVRPELGYTINNVTVDGNEIAFEGVDSSDRTHYGPSGAPWDSLKAQSQQVSAAQAEQAEQGGTYNGGATTVPALYTGDAQTSFMNDQYSRSEFFEVYKITIPNVTHDITANVDLVKVDELNPNGEYDFVRCKAHSLEITSEGGGTVSPLGKGFLPEGQSENIRIRTYSSYFLESVICTYEDGTEVDMTHRVVGNNLQITMGDQGMSIHATFKKVGEASFVHFELGTAMNPLGNNIVDKVTPNPQLSVNGVPTDFVRDTDGTGQGELIGFLTDEVGVNGRPLVLDKVSVNGKQIPLTWPDSCYVYIPTTAGGIIDITYREIEEGHTPIVPDFFTITGEVTSGQGEISTGPFHVTVGGSEKIGFKPAEGWLLDTENCFDWYAEEGASEMTAHAISAEDLKDGYYLVKGVDRDHKITVAFKRSVTLSIGWSNGDNGYVTPNTMNGEPLEVVYGESIDYIVAPYVGYDVKSVTETMDNAQSDVTGRLRMSEATTQALISKVGEGFTVKHTQEGMGVTGPVAEPQTLSRQPVVEAANGMDTALYADAPAANNGEAEALDNFNFAYGSQTSPITGDTEINAQWTHEDDVVKPDPDDLRTITVEVIGNMGGTADPMVAKGYDGEYITFQFIPEDGFAVRFIEVTLGGKTDRYESGSSGGKEEYTYGPIEGDGSIKVGFDSIAYPGANDTLSRYLRTLQSMGQSGSSLAQTGDLVYPVIATLLGVAALALLMAFVTRRRKRKHAGRHA